MRDPINTEGIFLTVSLVERSKPSGPGLYLLGSKKRARRVRIYLYVHGLGGLRHK